MANALKTLFTNIAGAIRETLPDEPSMSPYSYPDKIREVAAVSSSAGGSGGNLIYKSGEITITSAGAISVEHNSGQIPDMIMVFPLGIVKEGGYITHYIGYSEACLEALGEDAKCFCTSIMASNGSPLNAGAAIGFDSASVNTTWGHVSNVTSTSFTIGGTVSGVSLAPNIEYMWIAISGIA